MKAPNKSLEHSGSVVVPPISKDPVMLGPNISGHADLDTTFVGNSLIFGASGAFSAGSLEDDGIYATYKSDASVKRHGVFDLSADRSSGYYGRSSGVQPGSIRILPCVKT